MPREWKRSTSYRVRGREKQQKYSFKEKKGNKV